MLKPNVMQKNHSGRKFNTSGDMDERAANYSTLLLLFGENVFLYKEKGFAIDKKYTWSSFHNNMEYLYILMNGKHTHAHLHTHKVSSSPFYAEIHFFFFCLFQFIFSIDFDVLVFKLLSALYFHTLDF